MKIYQILLAFLFLVISFTSKVYASEQSISIDPTLTRVIMEPGQKTTYPFLITNLSETPLSLSVQLIPFTASSSQNGEVDYIFKKTIATTTTFDFLKNVVLLLDGSPLESITLSPHQQKKLELEVVVPENEKKSDYYFSVVFISNPSSEENIPSDHTYTLIKTGVASNVILTVGSNNLKKAAIEKFHVPFFLSDDKPTFSLSVKNTGSQVIKPTGSLNIENMFGQTVGKIELASPYILSDTVRYISNRTSIVNYSDPKIIWNESFLFGLYSATLNLQIDQNGDEFTRTILFLAIPGKAILIAFGVLLFVIFLATKVVKKL